jgi:gamma-glutamylcyclotransferase (GGCT)/AIG2-like uncharacterized protein YtfP
MLLFVYGTLRRGGTNHAQLQGARYVTMACSAAQYELVDLGGYPALLEDGHQSVIGELYEVDAALTRALDEFEDVPTLYERKRIELYRAEPQTGSEVSPQFADAYVLPRARAQGAPALVTGDWLPSTEYSADATRGRL